MDSIKNQVLVDNLIVVGGYTNFMGYLEFYDVRYLSLLSIFINILLRGRAKEGMK